MLQTQCDTGPYLFFPFIGSQVYMLLSEKFIVLSEVLSQQHFGPEARMGSNVFSVVSWLPLLSQGGKYCLD